MASSAEPRVVLEGEVRDASVDATGPFLVTRYTVAVDWVEGGVLAPTVELVLPGGRLPSGWTQHVGGVPVWRVGDRVRAGMDDDLRPRLAELQTLTHVDEPVGGAGATGGITPRHE